MPSHLTFKAKNGKIIKKSGSIKMNFKAYCTDLDGTLLNSKAELSAENKEAMKKIVKEGVLLVPTSGRTIKEMPESILEHPSVRYLIYSNGAGVIDKLTGERSEVLINSVTAHEIFGIMKEYPHLCVVHHDLECYVDGEALIRREEYFLNDNYYNQFLKTNVIKSGFIDLVRKFDSFESIVIFFGKNTDQKSCIEKISKVKGIFITSSVGGNIEIMADGANKGSGIKRFAKMVNVDLANVICSGDGENDIDMLKACGLSLAVANSKPKIKACAKELICSCDEHVAKFVYENYIAKN